MPRLVNEWSFDCSSHSSLQFLTKRKREKKHDLHFTKVSVNAT